MRAHRTRQVLFVMLALGFVGRAEAAPGKGADLLAEARTRAAELAAKPERHKLRHHVEKVITAWGRAAQGSEGASRLEALEGELEASRLLAKWSGLAADKAKVAELERGLGRERELAARVSKRDGRAKAEAAEPKKVEARAPASPAPSQGSRPGWLTRVNVTEDATTILLQLDTQREVTARRELLPGKPGEPARLYFDLVPLVASREALGVVAIRHPGIKRMRVGQFDAETVRVVIDFTGGAHRIGEASFEGHALTVRFPGAAPALVAEAPRPSPADGEGPRAVAEKLKETLEGLAPGEAVRGAGGVARDALAEIVDDVRRAYPEVVAEVVEKPAEKAVEKAVEKAATPEPVAPAPPAPEEIAPERAAPRRASASLLRIRRIVIDAGHGGKDQGARGVGGVLEKDVNLAIAQRLGKELEKRLGVEVVYTRTKDVYLSLEARSKIANDANGDLFISVHSNAHRRRHVHGIETYYLNVTSDRYASRLARRENAPAEAREEDGPEPGVGMVETDLESLPTGALGRDLRLILADLAMRSATAESRRLAGYVQGAMVGTLRKEHAVKDLGVKHALFYVLLGARMPSVLIETGFVTHPEEGKRLGSSAYQGKLAASIAQGIARFVEERDAVARRLDGGDALAGLSKARAAP